MVVVYDFDFRNCGLDGYVDCLSFCVDFIVILFCLLEDFGGCCFGYSALRGVFGYWI